MTEAYRKVGAKKWVKSKKRFPRDEYLESIDEFIERREKLTGGRRPSDPQIAAMLAVTVNDVGDLRTHASRERVVATKEEWPDMCEATGWEILRAYYSDIEKGKWPK